MNHSRWLLTALLAGCAGSPATPVVTPEPTPPPPPTANNAAAVPAVKPGPQGPSTAPGATSRTAVLDTGLALVLTTLPAGHDALVQFGLLAGTATQAPGLAELTMYAVLTSADPSRGRPSLATAIGALGGTARLHAGVSTTWLELRVPGALWPKAVQALRQALDSPQQSRHQLERAREALVASTAATIAADPMTAMAQQLLLGSADTAVHCNDLIDRDAGEIGAFQARMLRPDRCMLAVEAPETTDTVLASLRREAGGLGSWKPTATGSAAPTTLDRPFVPGVHWVPDGVEGPCRVGLVVALPDLARTDAAAAFLLHACVTLDGIGGRFEQLQRERGLGHLRWRTEVVHTPESSALLLRTEAVPGDAAALWRTWNLARQSLGDVPPTAEERALARRRAPLSARLALLDAGARGRTVARLLRAERSLDSLDAAFAALDPDSGAAMLAAVDYHRSLPCALVVLGGDPPPDLEGVHPFSPLPKALAAATTGQALASTAPDAANAAPWLVRAIEAVGGKHRLVRLQGWRSDAKVGNDRSPAIGESVEWAADGTLVRSREVLGQTIVTTLRGNDWSEALGMQRKVLEPREAQLLRNQQRCHPLALLAAHARGEMPFKVVSQRNVGDRDLMVLEAIGDRDGRLRVHLDAESCLVRAVEVWETLPDGTVVHVHDAWSDYRTVQGLRTPFHRLSTQDDGQNRVETTFTRWAPTLH